jgi:iron-sulfur cluster assembly protein
VLTLTENASNIVKTIVEQTSGSDDAGLRFSQAGVEDALSVAPAEAAEPEDQVVEKDGAKVFLDKDASVALGDKILDAQVDPEGSVQFSIAPQA